MKKEYIEAALLAKELKVGVREFEILCVLYNEPLPVAEIRERVGLGKDYSNMSAKLSALLNKRVVKKFGVNNVGLTLWGLAKPTRRAFERRDS